MGGGQMGSRCEELARIGGPSGAAKVEDRPLKPAEHYGLARMLPRCGVLFLQVPAGWSL